MKVVQINATCGVGSTGKICRAISELLTENGIENYILYSMGSSDYPAGIQCVNPAYIKLQAVKAKFLGNYGFHSRLVTKRMIHKLEEISPDIVHLHNIHGHDCNLEMLFEYFKEKKIKLVWTCHDCWAFTGYCTHFTMAGCEKWKTECSHCIQRKEYSLLFDRSRKLYRKKRQLFNGLDLTIVTPSRWLSKLVNESFLKSYPVRVIHNGIDLEVFRPVTDKSKKRKHRLVAVSSVWDEKKGLDVLVNLAGKLDPRLYQIVIVGTNPPVERLLPDNIIPIRRTQNQRELAAIYAESDVLVNPTREDNFPTVNIEALACGTPVITFRTGGSPEILDESCGSVVACDDIESMAAEIIRVCEEKPYTVENCRKRAYAFEDKEKFREYIDLYQEVLAR